MVKKDGSAQKETSGGENKTRRGILTVVAVIAACVMVFSGYKIISTVVTGKQEQGAFDTLAEKVEKARRKAKESEEAGEEDTASPGEDVPTPKKPTKKQEEPLPEYVDISAENDDFYGWIKIEGTPVDYPVMYTPDDPQHYLRLAFDGTYSISGTPFLDGACYEGCGIRLIYGHHMRNGMMFGSLKNFASIDYWNEHKILTFDTRTRHRTYEIFAAFYARILDEGEEGFCYYDYTDLTDPEVFDEYIENVKKNSEIDTGIDVEFGDEIVTLSTCSYHTENGRFVVVAREVKKEMTFGNVFILGDSYSSYKGTMPQGYPAYYGDENVAAAELDSVDQMWWHMLISETGSHLVQNNSWSGAPIATMQYGVYAPNASYSTRIRKYVQNGKCDGEAIDTVFVFGGTNDDWGGTAVGELKYDNLTEEDLKTVLPALIDVIAYLQDTAPQTRVVVLINNDLSESLTNGMIEICKHFGVEYVKFVELDKEAGHPTVKGMQQIKAQILETLR